MRTSAKWLATVIVIALGGAVALTWSSFTVFDGRLQFYFGHGVICVCPPRGAVAEYPLEAVKAFIQVQLMRERPDPLMPHWRSEPTWYWGLSIPAWMLLVPALVAALALWRGDIRRWRLVRAGRCWSCGYERAGLAKVSACPECGKAP